MSALLMWRLCSMSSWMQTDQLSVYTPLPFDLIQSVEFPSICFSRIGLEVAGCKRTHVNLHQTAHRGKWRVKGVRCSFERGLMGVNIFWQAPVAVVSDWMQVLLGQQFSAWLPWFFNGRMSKWMGAIGLPTPTISDGSSGTWTVYGQLWTWSNTSSLSDPDEDLYWCSGKHFCFRLCFYWT